jgi:hypothetical protein
MACLKYILNSVTFFTEIFAFYVMIWKKHCTVGQATDDNTVHAHCMLDI